MDAKIVSLDDIEAAAATVLPRNALDYFRSGAEDMVTLKDNREAFKRYVMKENIQSIKVPSIYMNQLLLFINPIFRGEFWIIFSKIVG